MIKGFVSMTVVLTIVTGITPEGPPSTLAEAARRGDMKALRGFLEDGASVEPEGIDISAVDYSFVHDRVDIYRYLRDIHGADVNSVAGSSRWTPLNHAIHSRKIATVREVLNDGSSLEVRKGNNRTPLLQSIHAGDVDVIRELINRGADIHARDDKGFNPLMAAIFYRQREIALELTALGSAVNIRETTGWRGTPLLMAVTMGWEDVATALVEAGADVDACDDMGITPMIMAAKQGYLGIVEMLIEHHADVNRISKCSGQYSAILAPHPLTTHEKRMEMIRLLLEKGKADPNLKDSMGLSLLHRIAESRMKGVAPLLIQFGARVDARDKLGRTPKDIARSAVRYNACQGWTEPDLNEEWVAEFGP